MPSRSTPPKHLTAHCPHRAARSSCPSPLAASHLTTPPRAAPQVAYIFPAELFPTAIRASALGVANVFSRCGSILAPATAQVPQAFAQLCLGAVAVSAGLLALLLPETRGRPLAEERDEPAVEPSAI